MKILDKLERRFGRYAIPNIALVLVLGQVVVYGMMLTGRFGPGFLTLIPGAVIHEGQYWRLFSFVLSPPFVAQSVLSAIFLAFFWYLFWLMSSALENVWGAFRFNSYLLLGVILTIATAFLGYLVDPMGFIQVQPGSLYLSVFLAFAMVNPNFELMLFLILPVKVKWLAWIAAAGVLLSVVGAPSWGARLAIVGPLLNFAVFFWGDFRRMAAQKQHKAAYRRKVARDETEPFHKCERCGASDASDPDKDFRYKTDEDGSHCYCEDCLVKMRNEASAPSARDGP